MAEGEGEEERGREGEGRREGQQGDPAQMMGGEVVDQGEWEPL